MAEIEAKLEQNPNDEAAFQQGVDFLSRQQDWKKLERFYRRNLKRLPPSVNWEMNVRLWRELAHVYQDRLHHPKSARLAFETAAKIERAYKEWDFWAEIEAKLEKNPTDGAAFQQGVDFLSRQQDWKKLERFYRRNLKRLDININREMSVRLWKELARVYRDRLHNLESAQLAFELVVRLAPNDRDLQAEYQTLLEQMNQ